MEDDDALVLFGLVLVGALLVIGGYAIGARSWWADDTIRATALVCRGTYKDSICRHPRSVWWIDFTVNRARGTVTWQTKNRDLGGLTDCHIADEENWICTKPAIHIMQDAWLKVAPAVERMRFVRLSEGRWLRVFGPPEGATKIMKNGRYETLPEPERGEGLSPAEQKRLEELRRQQGVPERFEKSDICKKYNLKC